MGIYKFALNFEKENRKYYEKCASETKSEHLTKIFNYLANEEKKHEEIVRKLADGEMDTYESDILPKSKEIFQAIADDISRNENIYEKDNIGVYRKAVQMEQESHDFYKEKAEETDNAAEKKVLMSLAKEERRHEIILDNILEHMERPEEWVEHAMFTKMEEY